MLKFPGFPGRPGLIRPLPTSALKTFGKSEEKPTRPSGRARVAASRGWNDPPPFQPKRLLHSSVPPNRRFKRMAPIRRRGEPTLAETPQFWAGGSPSSKPGTRPGFSFPPPPQNPGPGEPSAEKPRGGRLLQNPTDPPIGLLSLSPFRRFRPQRGGSPRHGGPEPKKTPPRHRRLGHRPLRGSGGCWFRKSCAGTRSGGGTHSSAVERLSCKQLVVGSIPTVSSGASV